jgi:hypothetical protein
MNGTEWKDQYLIDVKNPNFIKANPKMREAENILLNVANRGSLNIH